MRSASPNADFHELSSPEIKISNQTYIFKDTDIEPGTTYQYRVEVPEGNGRRTLFESQKIEIAPLPLTLFQNYPNPFNPVTIISYYLPDQCNVKLKVYDVAGHCIATLVDRNQMKGFHKVEWDGMNRDGSRVTSGLYMYLLVAGKKRISRSRKGPCLLT